MTPQQFGDKVRRQREVTGASLAVVAQQTKINRLLLADIERGDCRRWPGGLYARAYIREYGQAIGLDGEELVAHFCEIFPQFARPPVVPPEETAAAADASARRGWFAQMRDFFHRGSGRLDLFTGIERSE